MNKPRILKIPLTLILFILACFLLNSQEIQGDFKIKRALEADTFVGIDEFQGIYYIKDNTLYKKSKDRVFSYANIALGKLKSVNIQNPFKLLLFYEDFNALIILDNNLNELSPKIDFTQETLFNNVKFISGSSQNNIWLYADDNKLHLYDYHHLSEQLQTQALTFYDENFQPKSIISTYKYVWILSQKEVIQFNEYGVYLNTFQRADIKRIFPYQKGFIYLQESSFSYFDGVKSIPIVLDQDINPVDVSVNNSFICIYDGHSVFQFELKSRKLP